MYIYICVYVYMYIQGARIFHVWRWLHSVFGVAHGLYLQTAVLHTLPDWWHWRHMCRPRPSRRVGLEGSMHVWTIRTCPRSFIVGVQPRTHSGDSEMCEWCSADATWWWVSVCVMCPGQTFWRDQGYPMERVRQSYSCELVQKMSRLNESCRTFESVCVIVHTVWGVWMRERAHVHTCFFLNSI